MTERKALQNEPWLRGPVNGVDPLVANLFHTFTQVREELETALDGLTADEIWRRPHGLASFGFHVRHLGGAAERLACYLGGGQLTDGQLRDLRFEAEPGAGGGELLEQLRARLERVESQVKAIDPGQLAEPKEVGRGRLPSTAIGLIVHISEHSQRHLGQAAIMAKLARSLREE